MASPVYERYIENLRISIAASIGGDGALVDSLMDDLDDHWMSMSQDERAMADAAGQEILKELEGNANKEAGDG